MSSKSKFKRRIFQMVFIAIALMGFIVKTMLLVLADKWSPWSLLWVVFGSIAILFAAGFYFIFKDFNDGIK